LLTFDQTRLFKRCACLKALSGISTLLCF